MAPNEIVAGGCLVTRGSGADLEVLLVHRPKYRDWSLPKGKQEPGEHVTITAAREVAEETGVHVALRQPLPGRRYKVGDRPKVVHYWRAELLVDNGLQPNSEVDKVAWLSVSAAKKQISHPMDAELVALAKEPIATPFVVLRHAHATKRADWSGKDPKRPLDAAGFEQAEALVGRLAAYGVSRVHSSAAQRCVQTVRPYAEHEGVALVLEPELTEEGYEASPQGAKSRASGLFADGVGHQRVTVLCGHRPYLPDLLNHLLEGSGLTGPQDTVPVASMLVLHAHQGDEGLTVSALEHHVP